jgi:hypothetical protein
VSKSNLIVVLSVTAMMVLIMWPLVQSETDIAYYGQNFLTKKKSQFQFLWVEDILTPLGKISIILWLGKPLQRTIEILPLGVTDFPILYSLRR